MEMQISDSGRVPITLQASGLDLDQMERTSKRNLAMVIEDEPETLRLLKLTLRQAGFDVVGAMDGKQAVRKWGEINPAIALLDLKMPNMDGWETLRELRSISNTPIIIVSAIDDNEYLVRALREGADDYIVKPVRNREIIARVKAMLRRTGASQKPKQLLLPKYKVKIDFEVREVRRQDRLIELTPRQFSVLSVLARRYPKPASYQEISEKVWGVDTQQSRNRIKWIIHLLRQKIEANPKAPRLILNKVRYGYQLAVD